MPTCSAGPEPKNVALSSRHTSLVTEADVRAVLPTIRVPTLVVHHAEDAPIPAREGQVHRRKHGPT